MITTSELPSLVISPTKQSVGSNVFALSEVSGVGIDNIAGRAGVQRILLVQLNRGQGHLTEDTLRALAGVFGFAEIAPLCRSFQTHQERLDFWRQELESVGHETLPASPALPGLGVVPNGQAQLNTYEQAFSDQEMAGALIGLAALPSLQSGAPLRLSGRSFDLECIAALRSGEFIPTAEQLYAFLDLVDSRVAVSQNPHFLKLDQFVRSWWAPERGNADKGEASNPGVDDEASREVAKKVDPDHDLFRSSGVRDLKQAFGYRLATLAKRQKVPIRGIGPVIGKGGVFVNNLRSAGTGKLTPLDVIKIAEFIGVDPDELLSDLNVPAKPVEKRWPTVEAASSPPPPAAPPPPPEPELESTELVPTAVPETDNAVVDLESARAFDHRSMLIEQLEATITLALLGDVFQSDAQRHKADAGRKALGILIKMLHGEEVDPDEVNPAWQQVFQVRDALASLKEADPAAYQSLVFNMVRDGS